MTKIRSLRFAGSFFPADPDALAAAVDQGLAACPPLTGALPRAVISAHAGYAYSGRFTGMALAAMPVRPELVVVLSPSHRHAFAGVAYPSDAAFDTGLGLLPINRERLERLAAEGLAHEDDAAHDSEHGIETQLPFLARRFPGVPIAPLVIGAVATETVAVILDALAGPGVLVVLSSDLSHFLTDPEARTKDASTAALIERGEAGGLTGAHACGARAVAGWLTAEAGQASRALRLGMGNSGAVSGDLSRVVGYGAWAFYGLDDDILAAPYRATLLRSARQALEIRLRSGKPPAIAAASFAPALQGLGASFVTLTQAGRLRGCIGSLLAHRPLMEDVIENAQKAGLSDPRFAPVTAADLPGLQIKIAVLTRAAPLTFGSEAEALAAITPGRDGLIFSSRGQRGTFLPMVWDALPDPGEFLRALKRKAGFAPDYWAEDVQISRYRAESFREEKGAF
ncbi:hypothetical protein C8J30_10752 [Rhodobacter viridis]|uniref:AMMECR1 domain-containing protein n=1 Tax=Rhodobacter viridis TaxID=1054202 RepID=A0A318U0Y2_9RHOB|nr:AmmeMemoRadiSam system protein A [Rhodobacter viridis]PYF09682.1 hypothetical protein C8J30_10752 [Rhodobacter viridis]